MYKTLLLFLSISAPFTSAETILIQNKNVEVSDITYRPGPKDQQVIHSVQLLQPETFQFPNQTSIELHGKLMLHDNGNIWMAEGLKTKGPVSWSTPFIKINLNCNVRPQVNGLIIPERIIEFHSNGQYLRGCDSLQKTKVLLEDGGELTTQSFVSVDLSFDGRLTYARKIESGQLIIHGHALELEPGSEVAFYNNGRPSFFTAIRGSSFHVPALSGRNILVQQMQNPVSTQLFEDGSLERGLLGEPLFLKDLEMTLPKNSAVVFEKTPDSYFLSVTRLGKPMTLKVDNHFLKVSQIQFTKDSKISGLEVIEDFTFYPPEEGAEPILIPAPARVTLASNGQIVHIEVR